MKVSINADIEGIAGVGHWEEAIRQDISGMNDIGIFIPKTSLNKKSTYCLSIEVTGIIDGVVKRPA